MARGKGIKEAVREAKAIKKKHPHKYDHLKKQHRWSKGYMKQAFATVNAAPARRKPAKRKKVGAAKKRNAAPRKTARKKAAPRRAARKKSTRGLHLVKNVTKTTNERVMAGKKSRKRSSGSIGTAYRRRRSVGRSGSNTGLIIAAVGLGAIALLLLSKKNTTTQPQYQYQNLPTLQQTQNYTRNQQSNDLVNYAIAAGLAVNAIADLIERLNRSDDNEVGNIYDHVNTTGDVGAWV
jgi:hypothetical protein